MDFLPVFLNLKGKQATVVGGGEVAARADHIVKRPSRVDRAGLPGIGRGLGLFPPGVDPAADAEGEVPLGADHLFDRPR